MKNDSQLKIARISKPDTSNTHNKCIFNFVYSYYYRHTQLQPPSPQRALQPLTVVHL
jgi:hypothetical protein